MFNPKISAIAACVAFLLSLLVGIISGTGFTYLFLRAIGFGILFFLLASGAYWLIMQFIPELVDQMAIKEGNVDEGPEIGRQVDISIGEEGEVSQNTEFASKEAPVYAEGEDSDEMGSEFLSDSSSTEDAALDQNTEDSYTGLVGNTETKKPAKASAAALPPGILDEVDILPDLESMSDSFVSPIVTEDVRDSSFNPSPGISQKGTASLDSGGNFDANEMAQAIRTILKRDQKG